MLVSCVVVLSLRWNSFEAHKMEEFASLVVPASGGMQVLDVGGRVIQGGARSIFEARGCNFTSLDIQADKSVDVVSPPGQPFPFADGHFDLVITSSTFEHDPMFWLTIRRAPRCPPQVDAARRVHATTPASRMVRSDRVTTTAARAGGADEDEWARSVGGDRVHASTLEPVSARRNRA